MVELYLSITTKPKIARCVWPGTPVIFRGRTRIRRDVSTRVSFSVLLIPHITTPNRNIAEMSQITPETAVHYSFYSSSGPLGPTAAFEELQNAGCTLATEDWVHNHWGLILWKQAGMLCLDPSEAWRWSWEETIKQLLYRCVLSQLRSLHP